MEHWDNYKELTSEELEKITGGNFPSSLKFHRLIKGMTQDDLAKIVVVDTHTISNWERGITKPCAEDLFNLSSALKESMDNLWDGRDQFGVYK
ncbi:MAG: helix-turn-helix domain-containing protein [Streptococcaceae bacterium]|jgi:bacteriocin-like protein|nr:helix-turn-helix domain-containing protein [Streptococcaceae bacterium]